MGSQSRLSLVPATRTGRHHRYFTSTTACWLISRCIIIGHSPLRACPPQTGCTPAFPLGSLDAIFSQHGWQKEHLPDCCRSVTAPRLRLMKRLTYLNCWIWLAGYGVIPSCARSPAFLSGIFNVRFVCLCRIHTRDMRGFPEETICPEKVPLIRYSQKNTF